ncbi:MAG: NYN domain-containing protein [Deinococcus-Thermus bacterium]|jgi:uncharacterized LabA/DUF88 family protein|nr:NYN domain-containing protein [Deinococcota bacterium]
MTAAPQFAILLDGGFVTKKLSEQNRRATAAEDVEQECERLKALPQLRDYDLLRIYYYDAPPSDEAVSQPISGNRLSLAGTTRFREAQSLYDRLVLKPNFALRMGETRLARDRWKIKPHVARQLRRTPRALDDDDFILDISQKGVDMRIGMDMARLALRDMVRAVVVVTGDSDFIPAFKFVRQEGVKVILDTLGHKSTRLDLKVHADIVI